MRRVVLLALLVGACGGEKPSTTVASGASVFAGRCQTCHQATGLGVPGTFPPLVGSRFVIGDEARLIRIVLLGLHGPFDVGRKHFDNLMPSWRAALNDAEIAAVLTYVRSSWGNNFAAVSAEAVAHERAATADRDSMLSAAELR